MFFCASVGVGFEHSFFYVIVIRIPSCSLAGSLMRKSKSLGLQVEELKLPPITNMDAGNRNCCLSITQYVMLDVDHKWA